MENLTELIAKAAKGDRDAFGRIYKIYFNKIYRYCRINLGSEAEAEDLAQETFLKAWRFMPRFSADNGGSIQAFLFRIARNNLIDLSRKKKEVSLESAMEIETSNDFEEMIDKKVEIRAVQKALEKLPEEERQMIILRYFEEMPNARIAEIMDSKEGAVRVRLHRLLRKLRGILNG